MTAQNRSTVVRTTKSIEHLPRNVREAVLSGFVSKKPTGIDRSGARLLVQALLEEHDILDLGVEVEDEFVGPNTVRRNGYFDNGGIRLPFTSLVRYKKPRPVKNVVKHSNDKPLPKDARTAVINGFDLVAGYYGFKDTFVWPNKIIRRGEHEPEGANFEFPYVQTFVFGRPA